MTRKETGKNRYKFIFGDKHLTLTTDKDNLFMEEVERLAHEKYQALKEKLSSADNETLAILMAVNSLSQQLEREQAYDKLEAKYQSLKEELSETKDAKADDGD
ncbi:cell division protein ZapA [Streptococcus sp. zg-JUN1979]|uniref:cell division protein ZapA n=1 Tax=Streptococcus sp. zg-JUN1979 TaxID=3391450 RepID=UPI0039A58D7B